MKKLHTIGIFSLVSFLCVGMEKPSGPSQPQQQSQKNDDSSEFIDIPLSDFECLGEGKSENIEVYFGKTPKFLFKIAHFKKLGQYYYYCDTNTEPLHIATCTGCPTFKCTCINFEIYTLLAKKFKEAHKSK